MIENEGFRPLISFFNTLILAWYVKFALLAVRVKPQTPTLCVLPFFQPSQSL